MEGLAEPGTTYVTEDTFKLTEALFNFEGMGEKTVKGKESAIPAYKLLPQVNNLKFRLKLWPDLLMAKKWKPGELLTS